MLGQALHFIVIGLCGDTGFVRMQPCAGEDPVMLFCIFECTVVRARTGAAADGENPLESSIVRALEHLGTIRVELVAFYVSVGIDVHEKILPLITLIQLINTDLNLH
jgi:hypothetical protein